MLQLDGIEPKVLVSRVAFRSRDEVLLDSQLKTQCAEFDLWISDFRGTVPSYSSRAKLLPNLLVRRQNPGSTGRALICPVPELEDLPRWQILP